MFTGDEIGEEELKIKRDEEVAKYVSEGMDAATAEQLVNSQIEDHLTQRAMEAQEPGTLGKVGNVAMALGLAGLGAGMLGRGVGALAGRGAKAAQAARVAAPQGPPSISMGLNQLRTPSGRPPPSLSMGLKPMLPPVSPALPSPGPTSNIPPPLPGLPAPAPRLGLPAPTPRVPPSVIHAGGPVDLEGLRHQAHLRRLMEMGLVR